MARVRVRVYPQSDADSSVRGKAFLGISINKRILDSLQSIHILIDWVRVNFGAADLLVGDYLNRHNHQAFDTAPRKPKL